MAYGYGMQGAPAVGWGSPGLPARKQADQSTYTRIVSGSDVLIPPQGAKFMRVAVVGAGASAAISTRGVGGGGCAASKLVPASPIAYSIGAATGTNGQDSTAQFQGYNLIGGGGKTNGNGGVGSGGDYNYSGGIGANVTGGGGGGAAGPCGNGGNGSSSSGVPATPGSFTGVGWGVGGGAGGNFGSNPNGGGGTGAASPAQPNATGVINSGSPWGLGTNSSSAIAAVNGGEMGGGGTGSASSSGTGGSGGMVVEWFY